MSKTLQDIMSEATRLTNEGRLAEATAAIQRSLGGISAPLASWHQSGEISVSRSVEGDA